MLSGKQEVFMNKILPPDATFLDLTAPLPKREEYLRRVVQNLDGHGAHRGAITVRIGVAGQGISPHYKFETPMEYRLMNLQGTGEGRTAVIPEAFIIYHGASHEKMTAFQLEDVRESHWSTKAMSYDDVRTIFGRTQAERRAR
jgi:hypothetical protein